MTRLFAMGVLAFALTGCGTVRNFTAEETGPTEPYGGVKIAIDRFTPKDDTPIPPAAGFWLADIALCAVGDTLTLPVTLPIALANVVQGNNICHYYIPESRYHPEARKHKKPATPQWLADSQPSSPEAPPTTPAAP